MTSEPKWIVWTQSPKANTAIGTAAGIVGLLGATAVASTAPVAGERFGCWYCGWCAISKSDRGGRRESTPASLASFAATKDLAGVLF